MTGFSLPLKFQHPLAMVLLFIGLLVFYRGVIFEDQSFLPPDTIASLSFQTLVKDADEAGIFPLWNPYIFCGMPGYASGTVHGERAFDLSAFLMGKLSIFFALLLLNSDIGWVLFYYFLFGVGVYFLVWQLAESKIAAFVAALGALFSPHLITWVSIGHMTKMPVLAFLPYVLLLLERLRLNFHWALAVILVFVLHFLFLPAHFQMIFYVYLAVGVYFLFNILRVLVRKQEWKGYVRAGTIFAVATGLAFLLTADGYLSTLEYVDYSIRGSGPLVETAAPGGERAGSGGGLDYDYATNWSFSPGEMMTFLVPSWYGFGWHTYEGPISQNQPIRLNTYFGPQPFTDLPPYMGVTVLFLAGLGLVRYRKDPFVQFLAVTIVLSLLISFGKEFSLVYDLFFYQVPFFNKFRVPSMILALVQIAVPILAGYGVRWIIDNRGVHMAPLSERRWKYAIGGMGIFFTLALIGRSLLRGVYEVFASPTEVGQRLA
ncbi:MAG: hypothetical protein WD295_03730, partial [Bacteroidota bacterium]